MPKSLFIDPNEVLRPKEHEIKFPEIPVMTYDKTVKEELEEAEQEMRELSAGLDLMWGRIKWDESIEDNLIDLKRTAYFLIAEVVQVYAMCEKGLRTNALKEVGDEQQG